MPIVQREGEQLLLFPMEMEDELEPKDTPMQEAFERYHNSHPDIYEKFCRICKELWDKGYRRNSAHFVVHMLRWEENLSTSGEMYKINHNFFPYYSRKFLREHQEYGGFFDLRPLSKNQP